MIQTDKFKKNIIYRGARHCYYSVMQNYYGKKYGNPISCLLEDNNYDSYYTRYLKMLESKSPKTYFIIRRSYKGIGLYTYVCVFVSFIAYCVEKCYIPVIDMQNYPSIYLNDKEIGKFNAWEFYYQQPGGVSVNDIPNGSRIIYGSTVFLPDKTPFITGLFSRPQEFALWGKIYKDFIHYNDDTKKYTEKELNIIEGGKVIGVLFRGTDYSEGKPSGHPIQPTLDQAVEMTRCFVDKYNCRHVYLATEESEAEKRFRKEFPGMILTNKREYFDNQGVDFSKHSIGEIHFSRDNDNYLKGLEYLSSINILSKCEYFIGGGAQAPMQRFL